MKWHWPSLEQLRRDVPIFHCMESLSLAWNDEISTHIGLENTQRNQMDLPQIMKDFPVMWSALPLLISKLCHGKLIIQSILISLMGLANRIGNLICNRSPVIQWTRFIFSSVVAVAGHSDLEWSWRLSLPLLNSAAHSSVDKPGEPSPDVANRIIIFAAKPFSSRYLITSGCQFLSICKRSCYLLRFGE